MPKSKIIKCDWCGKTIKGKYFTLSYESEAMTEKRIKEAEYKSKKFTWRFIDALLEQPLTASQKKALKPIVYQFCSLKCEKEYKRNDKPTITINTK